MIRKFDILIPILLLFGLQGFGQNLNNELVQINETLLEPSNLSLSMNYNLYASYTSNKIIQTEQAEFKKKDSNLYFKQGSIESIYTPDFSLVLDHDQKIVIYDNISTTWVSRLGLLDMLKLEQLKNQYDSVHFATSNTERTLKLWLKGSDYSILKINYNKTNFRITKITLYLKNETTFDGKNFSQPRLEVVFSNYNDFNTVDKDLFNTRFYFLPYRDTYKLLPKFKAYSFETIVK